MELIKSDEDLDVSLVFDPLLQYSNLQNDLPNPSTLVKKSTIQNAETENINPIKPLNTFTLDTTLFKFLSEYFVTNDKIAYFELHPQTDITNITSKAQHTKEFIKKIYVKIEILFKSIEIYKKYKDKEQELKDLPATTTTNNNNAKMYLTNKKIYESKINNYLQLFDLSNIKDFILTNTEKDTNQQLQSSTTKRLSINTNSNGNSNRNSLQQMLIDKYKDSNKKIDENCERSLSSKNNLETQEPNNKDTNPCILETNNDDTEIQKPSQNKFNKLKNFQDKIRNIDQSITNFNICKRNANLQLKEHIKNLNKESEKEVNHKSTQTENRRLNISPNSPKRLKKRYPESQNDLSIQVNSVKEKQKTPQQTFIISPKNKSINSLCNKNNLNKTNVLSADDSNQNSLNDTKNPQMSSINFDNIPKDNNNDDSQSPTNFSRRMESKIFLNKKSTLKLHKPNTSLNQYITSKVLIEKPGLVTKNPNIYKPHIDFGDITDPQQHTESINLTPQITNLDSAATLESKNFQINHEMKSEDKLIKDSKSSQIATRIIAMHNQSQNQSRPKTYNNLVAAERKKYLFSRDNSNERQDMNKIKASIMSLNHSLEPELKDHTLNSDKNSKIEISKNPKKRTIIGNFKCGSELDMMLSPKDTDSDNQRYNLFNNIIGNKISGVKRGEPLTSSHSVTKGNRKSIGKNGSQDSAAIKRSISNFNDRNRANNILNLPMGQKQMNLKKMIYGPIPENPENSQSPEIRNVSPSKKGIAVSIFW